MGVSGTWIGAHIYTPGLLAYLAKAKMLRAAAGLESYLLGSMQVTEFQALTGLLHHVVFTVALPKFVMYNLYDGLDQLCIEAGAVPRMWRLLFLGGDAGSGDGVLEALEDALGAKVDSYTAAGDAPFDLRDAGVHSGACSAVSRR